MSRFLPTNGCKWIDPKEFDFSKYTSNSSKRCVLEADLEYQKKKKKIYIYIYIYMYMTQITNRLPFSPR